MNYTWIDAYLCAKPGAARDFQRDWGVNRYAIDGKMFAMMGGYKDGRPLLTLKLDPEFSLILRAQYPDQVIPGYYANKTHWSSLFLDGEAALPDETVRNMCDNAHRLILMGLPKSRRAEIEPQAR